MRHKKLKVDYLMQYGDDIALLRDGLSLRRVRSRTGRAKLIAHETVMQDMEQMLATYAD